MCSIAMQYPREGGSMGERGGLPGWYQGGRNSIAMQGKEGGTNAGLYGTKVVVPIQGGTKVVPTQGISSADQSCNFGRREATRGGGTIVLQLTLWIITLSYYNTFGIPTFWYFWYSDT